jgi:cystathionine gamma-synthase
LTYTCGISAFFALIVNLRPNIIAISDGYHGCHSVIALHKKLYGVKTVPLYDPAAWDAAGLGEGDLVHIESPLNPTGEAINIAYYAEEAHKRGAKVSVDATFGPPPLQNPIELGADIVLHSGSKYLGGHSDMLCGVLATRHDDIWRGLFAERMYLGSVMGSLEGWLGIRSMRTLEIRIERQSENATKLALWLHGCLTGAETSNEAHTVQKAVLKVQHASIQALDEKNQAWLAKQMPRGYGPVFAIVMHSEQMAKAFPTKMKLFHHATSLGGCESLIEWRRMSDPGCDIRLLRVSVGIEGVQDLKEDIFRAIQAVL